jgi:pyruvoyl-dependent arginine decarboxylase (PvlArgDC)
MEIAASYTRKINLGLYGGNDFEMKDFFHSVKLEIPDDQDPKGTMKELRQTCEEVVDEAIEEHIMDIAGGMTKTQWDTWLTNVVKHRKWGSVEDYEKMSPFQKNIAQMLKKANKRK